MKVSRVILAAVILLTVAFSQLKADLPAPLVSVDTVFKIKTNGSKGAVFLPDGNSVIMMCQDTPYLIDAKTWQVIRQFEYKPNEDTQSPVVSKDGKYLFAINNSGLAVWDIPTGKILKYFSECVDYCLSPDSTKLYMAMDYNTTSKGVIKTIDLKTLEEIDIFCDHNFFNSSDIACSPDGNYIAIAVHYPSSDGKTSSVILIDLKNKTEYTEIAKIIPFAKNLQFSPDGKYLMYLYSNDSNSKDCYIVLYNMESKVKKNILEKDISNLFEYKTGIGFSYFYNNTTISIEYSKYVLIWDLNENKLKKMVNFYQGSQDINKNKLLLCDPFGNLAQLDLSAVSVNELRIADTGYINFLNNQLEFTTDKNFIGESRIFDTTGKIISNLGTQQFIIGKNIIRINQPLPSGVYILTIKTKDEQISKKFIVDR